MRVPAFLFLLLCSLPSMAGRAQNGMPALPEQRTIDVFGQKIAYFDTGKDVLVHKPVIVLLHGLGSRAAFDWGPEIGPLAEHYRVIAPDQIGFGNSAKPLIDYSIQTYVDFLGEFLRELGVEHFVLAGESLGGWIAADYTLQALSPENAGRFALPRPEKLILEDAAGHTAPASLSHLQLNPGNLRDQKASFARIFYDKSRASDEAVRASFAGKLATGDGATVRSLLTNPALADEVVTGKLAAITIPTLVVWGANDELVPVADGKDYTAKIPGAKLVLIPESGHVPAVEKPREFLAEVTAFLGE